MDSRRKLATTSKHTFNKSDGSGCNYLKNYLLSQFEDEGMQGVCSENQHKKMNKCLCWTCFFIHCIDRHGRKIHRANERSLPKNLEGLDGEHESALEFKSLNKE